MPSIGPNVQTVRRELLAGYSSDYYSLGQQGAKLVDKIVKGIIPKEILVRVDVVIE